MVAVTTAQSYGGPTVISSGTLSVGNVAATVPVLAGLAYQLDASNVANLSLSGTNVTAWNDSTANGVNFTQSSGSNQPGYVASAISGLGAVSFVGDSRQRARRRQARHRRDRVYCQRPVKRQQRL